MGFDKRLENYVRVRCVCKVKERLVSKQMYAGPESASAFDAPYPQLTLRIYTITNELGRDAETDFVPGYGKP